MDKKNKKRAARVAVTAAASASVLLGGLFTSPADLLQNDNQSASQNAIVQMVDDDVADEEVEELDGDKARRRGGLRSRTRQWVLQLPVGVRALVGVPLWCVGWVVLTALSALWSTVISPLAGTILGWVLLAAALLGVFALAAKAMFPDVPLRKILCKRNVLTVLAGVLFLGVLDTLLPYLWDGYDKAAQAVRLTGSFLTVLIALWALAVRELRRRRRATPPVRELSEKERRLEIQRRARELADSVR